MRKIFLLFILFLIPGCFSTEMSEKEFQEKQLAGTYKGVYQNEDGTEKVEFLIDVDDNRIFTTFFGSGSLKITKDYKVSGSIDNEDITFTGEIKLEDPIVAFGKWQNKGNSGNWEIVKQVDDGSNLEDEVDEIEEKKFNLVTENLEAASEEAINKMNQYQAVIPGGNLRDFTVHNENIMGTPSDKMKSYKAFIDTSSTIEEVKIWLHNQALLSNWSLFDEHEFPDKSFNMRYIHNDSVREMLLSAYERDDYTVIIVTFDNR